jgi:ectoine hydroxylase-related dioxygenase (phytanoyl-CoA dioxygenase family)
MGTDGNADLGARFRTQGYVRLDGFFSPEEISKLEAEIVEASRSVEGPSSLDRDGLTFDENVFLRSRYVQDFISQEKVVDVLSRIIGPGCFVRWDQCVRKLPGGFAFPWHQDNAYSRLRDEHFQFWVALTESTRENGGLSLRPTGTRTRLPHTWVGNHLVCTVQAGEEVFIRAARGDVVVFSSFVLHHTGPNETDAERATYVVEYMSLDSYDPLLRPPYFVVAANGERWGRFVETYPGRSLKNRLSYLPLQAATRLRRMTRPSS